MTPGGYFGRVRLIDVERRVSRCDALPQKTLRSFIGGVGLGTYLLDRYGTPRADPLGKDATLVFAFSPLVGTPVTTSAKFAVVSKSPLTMRLNDALSSSDFAVLGKRTGHDALILQGRGSEPLVVLIDDDEVRFEAHPELWGSSLDIDAVDEALQKRYPGFSFAITGVAGENGVRYASLSNGGRHAGRGGTGAVLGAMRIKAVGVRGSRGIPLHAPEDVVQLSRDLARRSRGMATAKYRELGTIANLTTFNRLAALPTRNFQSSQFEGAENLSAEQLHATRHAGRSACRNCTIGCEHFFSIGKPSSENRVKMEYESLFSLGPLCGIDDPQVVLAASQRCDQLGLDTISTGATIAFAMECAERGMISGFPDLETLRFGRGDTLLAMIERIAHRSDPLGDLLAEGSRRAAEHIGPEAERIAPHVKGLEIPGYEPRSLQTMALGFAVSSRGADHNRSGAYEADFSGRVDRFDPGLAAVQEAIQAEDRSALIDSLILCKFLRGVFDEVPGGLFGGAERILTAITGWELTDGELARAAERVVVVKKQFNVREGWSRFEDRLPHRFTTDRLPSGAASDAVIDSETLNAQVEAYYRARGWNQNGTVPDAHLIALGLSPKSHREAETRSTHHTEE